MRKHLSAEQVAELAELLEDAPHGVGVVDDVLQAAVEGRGMTLRLIKPESRRRGFDRVAQSQDCPRRHGVN